MEERDDYPIIPLSENKTKNEFAVREDKVLNNLIEVVENRHFLEELGPGGNWMVKDEMKEEFYALEDVKDFVSDCVEKIAHQGKELASLKEENALLKECFELSEQAKNHLRTKGYGWTGLDILKTCELVPFSDNK